MSTRRVFLRDSAKASAAALIMPWVKAGESEAPGVQVALYGLAHDHAKYMVPRLLASQEVKLVGIIESDDDLIRRYADEFHFERSFFVPTLETLLSRTHVRAVACFTSPLDHPKVVELCAERGIHVMMEKPLANDSKQAQLIATTARHAGIEVLVNYDTSWYPSIQYALNQVLVKKRIGEIHKVEFHTGHSGPGPSTTPQMMAWLTDPNQNGGALTDFGCYGAALLTVLMRNRHPNSVFAITQRFQAGRFGDVDDEASIVVTYPDAVSIIEASWNWARSHKEMNVYGTQGELSELDDQELIYREDDLSLVQRLGSSLTEEEYNKVVDSLTVPTPMGAYSNEFAYLAAVVRGKIKPSEMSSLETNLIVTELLDLARESARTGRRIDLKTD